MNKRFLINWAIWMGVTSGIYTFIYSFTPLIDYGVIWATFVALPIYLTSGGKKEEMINYICSAPTGVLWGIVFLTATAWVSELNASIPVANLVVTMVVTIVCVSLHTTVLSKTWFNKVPAIFGGIASTLASQNYTPNGEHWIPLAITLVCGVILGYINNYGQFLLTDAGRWKIGASK